MHHIEAIERKGGDTSSNLSDKHHAYQLTDTLTHLLLRINNSVLSISYQLLSILS